MKGEEHGPHWRKVFIAVCASLLIWLSSGCQGLTGGEMTRRSRDQQVACLNGLRDEINYLYGFQLGWPKINRGPCGRFAKIFFEEWNARFEEKAIIAFVMMTNRIDCDHVLVKLPNGSYFDGGSGVVSPKTLLRQFPPGDYLDEMPAFDLSILDKRSYGLNRSYDLCPNYSDEVTRKIVSKHLSQLANEQ